jgi:hypothetical protein
MGKRHGAMTQERFQFLMSITVSKIDARALSALVALSLHRIGPDARCEDFDQTPSAGLWNRIQEGPITVDAADRYGNGVLRGFEIGLEAAADILSDPMAQHDDEMREIVKQTIAAMREEREAHKVSA